MLSPDFKVARITTRPGDKATLWRYMDFPRFISILENRTLFFCPSNQLGDPLEGSLTMAQQFKRWSDEGSHTIEALEHSDAFIESQRQRFFVSCWHLSKCESNAMWKIYSHLHKGVAIRSTVGRLKRSITGFSGTVYIGSVDYSEKAANHKSMLSRLFLKRKSFAYEKEFRAGIVGKDIDGGVGLTATVDPNKLILSVELPPFCEEWLNKLVKQLLKRYGYRFQVRGGCRKIVF